MKNTYTVLISKGKVLVAKIDYRCSKKLALQIMDEWIADGYTCELNH